MPATVKTVLLFTVVTAIVVEVVPSPQVIVAEKSASRRYRIGVGERRHCRRDRLPSMAVT